MKKIIYIFLSRPVTAAMFFFVVVVLGIAAVYKIPLELAPEVEYPKLSVSAGWRGVSPEAVEAFLTSPLEAALSTVKGVKTISSRSSEGFCSINLEFHHSTDMNFARIEINEKLSALKDDMPYGVSRPRLSSYVPKEFKDMQGFLTFVLSAPHSANEIRKYALERIKTPLMTVKGVSNVEVSGGNERTINIIIDYDKARLYRLTNEKINSAVKDAENLISAGVIKGKGTEESARISNRIELVEKLNSQVITRLNDGTLLRLSDIGKIVDDFSEASSYYRINGKEAVFIEVDKEQGANSIETADLVFEKLAELSESFPPGYAVKTEIDRSKDVRSELSELFSNAFYSLTVIILLLILIFRRLSYSIIIVFSIAFSLLSALLLFYLFELSLNVITIASLVLGFGLMVDNSIVVVDYIDRRYNGEGIKRLTVSINEIIFPVFASTFTTAAVFIPLLFFTGELKLYFSQFALAMVFSIAASLIVSFTVVPMLFKKYGFKLNRRKRNSGKNYVKNFYLTLQSSLFKWKKVVLLFLILIVGVPIWLLPGRIETPVVSILYNAVFDSDLYTKNKKYFHYAFGGALNLFFNYIQKGEVFAYGSDSYIIVSLNLPHGNDIERINELTKGFENEILAYENNISNLITRVISEERAYLRIEFNKEQSQTAFPYMLKNYLIAYAVQLGGLEAGVSGYGMGFYSGSFITSSFQVQALGFNYNRVRELAEEFRKIIVENPRIENVDIDRSGYGRDKETFEVIGELNRDRLKAYNLKPEELFYTISSSSLGNLTSNRFRIGNDEIPYNIKYSNYKQMQLKEIEEMELSDFMKERLKVKDLIKFEERKILSSINRENRQYVRYISFDYRGPYEYGDKFIKSSINKISIPEGYEIKRRNYLFLLREEEQIEIWSILCVSSLLIFMITASLFESLKKPLIIIMAVPFAIIGTIFLFYFKDLNLDRGAYAGMLLLIGVSVNNSIILVDYLTKNLKRNSFEELAALSFNRIRPIMTTTFTTIAALIPILLFSEDSFWKSLSYSAAGGLLVSSFFTILFVPLFYSLICGGDLKNKTTGY